MPMLNARGAWARPVTERSAPAPATRASTRRRPPRMLASGARAPCNPVCRHHTSFFPSYAGPNVTLSEPHFRPDCAAASRVCRARRGPRRPTAAAGTGVRAEMLMWIKDAEDKLIQLAEATPGGGIRVAAGQGRALDGRGVHAGGSGESRRAELLGSQPHASFDFMTYEKSLSTKG